MACEICNNESGGVDVGVAAVPGVPMSIMWCDECLKRPAVPAFVLEHDYVFVADGDLANLAEWAVERVTWADGRYMTFTEYAQRIMPDEVAQQHQKYEDLTRERYEREDYNRSAQEIAGALAGPHEFEGDPFTGYHDNIPLLCKRCNQPELHRNHGRATSERSNNQ